MLNKKKIAGIFCDISKAFDCISHEVLLGKLNKYNFSVEATTLIKNYLSGRKQYVYNNNTVCPKKRDPFQKWF
jgi:hypothetical protein